MTKIDLGVPKMHQLLIVLIVLIGSEPKVLTVIPAFDARVSDLQNRCLLTILLTNPNVSLFMQYLLMIFFQDFFTGILQLLWSVLGRLLCSQRRNIRRRIQYVSIFKTDVSSTHKRISRIQKYNVQKEFNAALQSSMMEWRGEKEGYMVSVRKVQISYLRGFVSPKKSFVSPKIQNTFFSPTLRQSDFISFSGSSVRK